MEEKRNNISGDRARSWKCQGCIQEIGMGSVTCVFEESQKLVGDDSGGVLATRKHLCGSSSHPRPEGQSLCTVWPLSLFSFLAEFLGGLSHASFYLGCFKI